MTGNGQNVSLWHLLHHALHHRYSLPHKHPTTPYRAHYRIRDAVAFALVKLETTEREKAKINGLFGVTLWRHDKFS